MRAIVVVFVALCFVSCAFAQESSGSTGRPGPHPGGSTAGGKSGGDRPQGSTGGGGDRPLTCFDRVRAMTSSQRATLISACQTKYAALRSCQWPQVTPLSYASNSDPQCCPACIPCAEGSCSAVSIPQCGATEVPTARTDAPCCPTCIRSGDSTTTTCTAARERACATVEIPFCASGETATQNADTCCPSCRTPQTSDTTEVKVCSTVPPTCTAGQVPTRVAATGCPSCIAANVDADGCTPAKREACAAAWPLLGDCADGVRATQDPDTCCMTCKPVSQPVCSSAATTRCREAYVAGTIGDCAGTKPAWNASTCCASCVPTPTETGSKCTLDQFKECNDDAPVCTEGEIAVVGTRQCCPSCKRPERACSILAVARCYAALPICGTNEKPEQVDGQCCKTCKFGPPTCTATCADTEVCVRRKSTAADGEVTFSTECKPRTDLSFDVSASGDLARAFALLNADEIREIVHEYVRRYCDKAENFDKCTAAQDALDGLTITTRISCPDGEASTGGDSRVDGGEDGELSTAFVTMGDIPRNDSVRAREGCRVRVVISVAEGTASTSSGGTSDAPSFRMFAERMFASDTTTSGIVTSAVTSDSENSGEGLSASSSSSSNAAAPSHATPAAAALVATAIAAAVASLA